MAKNSLESLISDLDSFEKNFDVGISQKLDDIVARVMVVIGQSTAYDTGVARGLVKAILGELGREDLEHELNHYVYEYWSTVEKRYDDDIDYNFSKFNNNYSIEISDYGFSNQAQKGVISSKHPRNDNRVVPNQVDYAIDKMETESDSNINKAFIELEKFICSIIDGKV